MRFMKSIATELPDLVKSSLENNPDFLQPPFIKVEDGKGEPRAFIVLIRGAGAKRVQQLLSLDNEDNLPNVEMHYDPYGELLLANTCSLDVAAWEEQHLAAQPH